MIDVEKMRNTNKIACIGAGYWGKNLVRNFNELGVLSWVCDADPHRRAQLAMEYPDARLTDAVDQVLSDPDVAGVAIATPAVTHADLVQRALLAGKDVFVEKPLSLSVEEAAKTCGRSLGKTLNPDGRASSLVSSCRAQIKTTGR